MRITPHTLPTGECFAGSCDTDRGRDDGPPVEGGKEIPYHSRMIKSKLTAKAQTTIPQPVRDALRLRVGDEIAYEIQDGRVVLTKASAP